MALEKRLGRSLPADYNQFLLATNGGQPECAWFCFRRSDHTVEWSWVQDFFAVTPSTTEWSDVEERFDHYSELPDSSLPIAFTPGGGNIVLYTRDGRTYQVNFKDYGSCDEDGSPFDHFYHLADSFDEFLASLRREPPSPS